MNPPLILASSSPRRRELLASMRLSFRCEAVDVDEAVTGKPADIVITLAERKARQAAQAHLGASKGADTLVYAGGRCLVSHAMRDASRMLSALVWWHQVLRLCSGHEKRRHPAGLRGDREFSTINR